MLRNGTMMKVSYTALVFALLSVGPCACGGSSASPSSASHTSAPTAHPDGPHGHEDTDGDYDFDSLSGDYAAAAATLDSRVAMAVATGESSGSLGIESEQSARSDRDGDHDNHQAIVGFGVGASAAEQRVIGHAIGRYYYAAALGDGDAGCALLARSFARTVAPEYGHTRYLQGANCPTVLSKLFKRVHGEFAADHRTLILDTVRLAGESGVAIVSWRQSSREGQIALRREHGAWKMAALIDGPRPLDGEA